MIHHSIFDTPRGPEYLDLGPYEVEQLERVTIRRGQPVRPEPQALSGPAPQPLSGDAIGKLAIAGAALGTAIAFAIDAHGAAQALLSIVGR